uniref:Cytochrome b-c1 complex subunit 10 n=1 Tax=Sinocyclocheilus grahami TaxID=75366 RepID=A0A672P428_SINGR
IQDKYNIPGHQLVGWATVGGLAVVHFTDWRLILDCVPYIRGKFKKDDLT